MSTSVPGIARLSLAVAAARLARSIFSLPSFKERTARSEMSQQASAKNAKIIQRGR